MFTFDLKDTCCSFFILSYKVSPTKGSLGNKCCINKIIFVRTWLYFFSFDNNIAVPFITFFVLILISTSRFISRRTWKFVFVCNQMKGLYTRVYGVYGIYTDRGSACTVFNHIRLKILSSIAARVFIQV